MEWKLTDNTFIVNFYVNKKQCLKHTKFFEYNFFGVSSLLLYKMMLKQNAQD